ncbi:hypothetical protein [Polaribacter sp. Hel_I_88]|uniref:hypothetical protein n=1 Tax=Polaribacter sp. Hel_I_88 TaxID=1250006 RepID=UPI0004796E1F|nr:hypothetical protein [Polaribacter sp. Hel_I_88]
MVFSAVLTITLSLSTMQNVEAYPGIGGTLSASCGQWVCTGSCAGGGGVSVELTKHGGIEATVGGSSSGEEYTWTSGTEKSCGDNWEYCSWTGCRLGA